MSSDPGYLGDVSTRLLSLAPALPPSATDYQDRVLTIWCVQCDGRRAAGREFGEFQMEFTHTSIFELARRATDEAEKLANVTESDLDVTHPASLPSPSPSIALVTPSLVPLAPRPSLKRRRDELDDASEMPATAPAPA
ncbi:hypothetical protein C8F01DRAFT_1255888 [Mycena amicta]|nr:hypothetical protein C8F01DRAFT_1255888 [Mycena amicta]